MTLRLPKGSPRIVRVSRGPRATASVEVDGRAPGERAAVEVVRSVRHVLRFDEDLSPFYDVAATDPALRWVVGGAGRMVRSGSVFEEVVKTICTTNCAWSATVRMVSALVEHLGEPAIGAPKEDAHGRAFPTPTAMADADDDFYREVVRAGYRGRYLRAFARLVSEGELDIEWYGRATPNELPDHELAARLRSLPGVGPYAAAHVMMMIGRYSPLILDSWTRPTYARLVGRKSSDKAIARRFAPYGRYAGLAFWCFLTRGWIEETGAP